LDISTKNVAVIKIGSIDVWITETMVSTWVIMAALIALSLYVHWSMKRFKDRPGGFQNVIEILVETCDNFVRATAGSKIYYIGGWYFMVFAFMMASNLVGVVGLRAPTADWSMTFACALTTFGCIQFVGVKQRRMGYIKSFFKPVFIFLPLNIISELSRPISLSFRLFANVLSGTIILTLVYTIAPIYLRLFLPAAMHIYFDIITGAIQTYIFCVLSLTFIGSAAVENEG